jgi:hypothetical protein
MARDRRDGSTVEKAVLIHGEKHTITEEGLGAPVSAAQEMTDYQKEMKEYYSNGLEKASKNA